MAKYRLAPNGMIVRNEDEAWIPPDPGNKDRQEYEDWLKQGNTPDPEKK
jgi:hypothetical protein